MMARVTVELNGRDVRAGTLWCHARRGIESATFEYDSTYLENDTAIELSPDLPLTPGKHHSGNRAVFLAFGDCMPDRWGRNLMLRAETHRARASHETERALLERDFLLGVSDVARQGALRFWVNDEPVSPSDDGVPKVVRIPSLLRDSERLEGDVQADVADLFKAGSSLGGARPKASVIGANGELLIAKFPKAQETTIDDICAWEKVALDLAALCDIRVPASEVIRPNDKAVLLVSRFDRAHGHRIPYMSGLTAVQGDDGGQYSYLELVEFLEERGSHPEEDIRELWRRIAFSCLIGNTDDHMRNHGFLWDGQGWRLSPLFDVNPTEGTAHKHLRTSIDLDRTDTDVTVALDACEHYRLERHEALSTITNMRKALKTWRKAARSCGISEASITRMAGCFDAAANA